MKRLLFLLLFLPALVSAQTPAPFVGLSTSSTDFSSSWTSWYASNGSGVPGTYSGPGYGASQLDTIYGTTSGRAPRPTTDCPATSNNPSGDCLTDPDGYQTDYSKVVLWSTDNMFYINQDPRGWLWLYLWNNGAPTVVRRIQVDCNGSDTAEASDIYGDEANWTWSRTAGTHILYYTGCIPGGSTAKVALKAYDPTLDTGVGSTPGSIIHDFTSTIAEFPGCTQINNEREGEQSDDDNVWAFTCNTDSDNDQNAAMVYHKSTDVVIAKAFAAGVGSFCYYASGQVCPVTANYVTISPKGDYYIVNWNGGSHNYNWSPGVGTDVLDASTLNYIGGATGINAHGDVGCDTTGVGDDSVCNEVFVQAADQYESDFQTHMLSVCQLSSVTNSGHVGPVSVGGCQHFFRMPSGYVISTTSAMTYSQRATRGAGKGYGLLSGYDDSTTYLESTYGSLMNFAVQITWASLSDDNTSDQVAGSPNLAYTLGRTHSLDAVNDYPAQADGCPDIKFSKFSYTTTMDHANPVIPTNELPAGNQGSYAAMYTMLPISLPSPPTLLFTGNLQISGRVTF